jgi:excisionase family DNA binding protein
MRKNPTSIPAAAPPVPQQLLTLKQAASLLSIGLRTLRVLIEREALKVCRVSRRRLAVHPDDLGAYVASLRR